VLSRLLGRRKAITRAALAPMAAALTVIAGCDSSSPAAPSPSPSQVELPFKGLIGPKGLAVDAAGDVYVINDGSSRLLKLP
jgi:hypothetical protein